MTTSKKIKYYAYRVPDGKKVIQGIVTEWKKCEAVVVGKTGARFRAFPSQETAERWLNGGAAYQTKPFVHLQPGVYFDAGTGRGAGVEISVTDETGKNMLHKVVSRSSLNQYGKQLIRNTEATNNYGELLALRYAIEVATKLKIKHIFGDSRLVIEYWSKWRIKRNELPEETVALADEVSGMRETFEKKGGRIERIGGGHNPADLGFHT